MKRLTLSMNNNKSKRNLISAMILFLSSFLHASDSIGISPDQQALMDQLRICAETAINQGADSVEGIATQCSQEVADLDAALPNVSNYLIASLLN